MRKVSLPERLTSRDRALILAGFASCDRRAAMAFLTGGIVKPNLFERLTVAAEELGFVRATPGLASTAPVLAPEQAKPKARRSRAA